LLLLLLLPVPLQAAWYQVEVIVFESLNADPDGESFDESPGLPDRSYTIDLVTAPSDGAPTDAAANLIPYLALDTSRFRLDGVFRSLKLTRDYRPLLHVAWQQPGEGSAAERAVHLTQLREPAAVLAVDPALYVPPDAIIDGIVQLRVGRFLHVVVDMAYFPHAVQPAGAAPRDGAEYLRLRARRKVLLNDLNYFDHPLFGVLVQVSRLAAREEEKTVDGRR
jgi:hypothetical protein